MKRRLFKVSLTVLFLITSTQLFAQIPDTLWTRTYGGASEDQGRRFDQTDDGGYILTGYTYSYGAGDMDVWLIKTDDQGNSQWDQTYGGSDSDNGSSVFQTDDGGYIVGAGTYSYGAGGDDFWLIKTDTSGNSIWDQTYGGNENEYIAAAYQLEDGSYITGGSTWSYGGEVNFYLVKTDDAGNQQWSNNYGGPNGEHEKYLIPTSDGGYAMVGETWSFPSITGDVWLVKTDANGYEMWDRVYDMGQCEYGHFVQQTDDGGYIIVGFTGPYWQINDDVLLIKTDPDGYLEWTRTYGGGSNDVGNCVRQTVDGGYIIAGYTESYGAGEKDIWIINTDGSGNINWQRVYGGSGDEGAWDIQEIEAGEYAVLGYTDTYGAGDYDFWLLRIGGEGTPPDVYITMTPYNPPIVIPETGGSFDFNVEVGNNGGDPVVIDAWVQVEIPGGSSFTVMGPATNIWMEPSSSLNRDKSLFVPSIAPAGEYTCSGIIGVYPWIIYDSDSFTFTKEGNRSDWTGSEGWICTGESFSGESTTVENSPSELVLKDVYPNPFNPTTTISYNLPRTAPVEISIYDLTGRLVESFDRGMQEAGAYHLEWDASELASGIYLVALRAGSMTAVTKTLLLK